MTRLTSSLLRFSSSQSAYPGSERYHLFVEEEAIACLSKDFDQRIKEQLQKGYEVTDIEVESVVIWENHKRNEALKHALCKIILKKTK
jgi:hypothetical protein